MSNLYTTIDPTTCDCDVEQAATDPQQQISSHRTSQGHVVYFRCYCGTTRIRLVRWAAHSAA